MQRPAELPRVVRPGDGAPALPWLLAGALAGGMSGAAAFLVAAAGSALVGMPWYRPVNVVASLALGAHLAVTDRWREAWWHTAALLTPAAALAGGLVYGLLVALIGVRPAAGLAVRLGLLVGLLAWLAIVKGIAPVVAPLTVRLVPLWVSVGLFALYGVGLAAALPIARALTALFSDEVDDARPHPPPYASI